VYYLDSAGLASPRPRPRALDTGLVLDGELDPQVADMQADGSLAARPGIGGSWRGAGGRWLLWPLRVVLWTALAVVAFRGITAIIPGSSPAPAGGTGPANATGEFPVSLAEAYATEFGRVYLGFSPQSLGQREQVILESESAIKALLQTSNVYFFDVNKLFSFAGLKNAYNFRLGFLYQMPYTKDFITQLSAELLSLIHLIGNQEKKAIFVDCDNTLWLGILGEDGLEGIQCNRNAKGVLFFQFQEFLLEKKREGFIIGIVSKNNEEDVKEAFEKLNMPLKWNDFITKKVNWLKRSRCARRSRNTEPPTCSSG
jgi:HAD superfamily phosphatase (TIGR01681 family)